MVRTQTVDKVVCLCGGIVCVGETTAFNCSGELYPIWGTAVYKTSGRTAADCLSVTGDLQGLDHLTSGAPC